MRSRESFTTETRREVDRSHEQSEAYQGAETLAKLGVLARMRDLTLYHGRAADGTPGWHVRADFNNAGNATGNRNINKVPALNTGSAETARDFASARAARGGRPEVHRIRSRNPDSRIIDSYYNWGKLSQSQYDAARQAMRQTLPSVSEGIDLDFDDRQAGLGTRIQENDFCSGGDLGGYTATDDVRSIAARLGVSQKMAEQIGGARNVRMLLGNMPHMSNQIISAYVDGATSINLRFAGRNHDTAVPINREYIGNWLKNMDAVGARVPVHSATLGRDLDNYLLFELSDVDTEGRIEQERATMQRRMGRIAVRIAEKMNPDQARTFGFLRRKTPESGQGQPSEIMDLLNGDMYAKPHDVVEVAKRTPGYRGVFEASAGVWEGFTVQQHTETALQVFEDNYADKLPAKMLPMMRLALLTHDIGKGVAVAREGNKRNQKAYNTAYARDFLEKNHVDESMRDLIVSMIGDGMEQTTAWAIRGEEGSGDSFYNYCKGTMGKFLERQPSQDEVYGFAQMMLTLQTCDSASYTDMAVTRSQYGKYKHRNSPSFNRSFNPKTGLTGRKLGLKRDIGEV